MWDAEIYSDFSCLWSLCVFISLAISHSRIQTLSNWLNNWCKLRPLNPEFQVSTPRLTIWRAFFSLVEHSIYSLTFLPMLTRKPCNSSVVWFFFLSKFAFLNWLLRASWFWNLEVVVLEWRERCRRKAQGEPELLYEASVSWEVIRRSCLWYGKHNDGGTKLSGSFQILLFWFQKVAFTFLSYALAFL